MAGEFSGYKNPTFNPPKGANDLGLFSDFGNAYSAFLKPIMSGYGGTNWANWMGGQGKNQIQAMFEAQQQSEILNRDKQRASMAQQYGFKPDDPFWLQLMNDPEAAKSYGIDFSKSPGWNPTMVTSALDFLKALDPLKLFNQQDQRTRGEDPASYNPFVRFFGG